VRFVPPLTNSARRWYHPAGLGHHRDCSAWHPLPHRCKITPAPTPTRTRMDVLQSVATRCLPVQLQRSNCSFQGAASQHPTPATPLRPRDAPGSRQEYPDHCISTSSLREVCARRQDVWQARIPDLGVPVGTGVDQSSCIWLTTQRPPENSEFLVWRTHTGHHFGLAICCGLR
jgi:hypothetical protein